MSIEEIVETGQLSAGHVVPVLWRRHTLRLCARGHSAAGERDKCRQNKAALDQRIFMSHNFNVLSETCHKTTGKLTQHWGQAREATHLLCDKSFAVLR